MKENKLEKIAFLNDTHIPYHDKKAFELFIKVMKEFKPDHLILDGDIIDCYSVSDHSKNPNRALKLEEEINETKQVLKTLAELKAKNMVFIAGNHEDRLERYLMNKAPELFNVISIPKLLELKKLGFTYVPYKDHYELGKLNITHDTGTAGRFAAYKALDAFQKNVTIGHIHRISYMVEGNASGERHVAASFGWMGDVTAVDYMHRVKATRDWSLGFGIGYLDTSNDFIYLVPVPLIDYTCQVEGKLYKL